MNRRENAAVRTEVRMTHVRLLDGAGKIEREIAKVVGRHGTGLESHEGDTDMKRIAFAGVGMLVMQHEVY